MDVLGGVEADPLEVGGQLVLAVVVALLAPLHGRVIHLVDQDHQVLHSRRLHQHGVLARLAAALEAGLELAFARGDDEDGEVCLTGAPDHVGHEGLVAGRVQDREVLLVCLEVRSAHLHRLALIPLLLVGVHAPGQVPGLSVLLLGFLLILLQCSLIHHICEVHQLACEDTTINKQTSNLYASLTSDGGLPGIDVTNEDNINMFLLRGYTLHSLYWLLLHAPRLFDT